MLHYLKYIHLFSTYLRLLSFPEIPRRKTLKAYKIDFHQFCDALANLGASDNISDITTIPLPTVETFLSTISPNAPMPKLPTRDVTLSGIDLHITSHMYHHTFATNLLEANVDIRYIQEILRHSSINIIQIYTHTAVAKQRDILRNKHLRKWFKI